MTDLRRAEDAVVEAGMAASLIFNNYEDPKRQDNLLLAMVNLGSKCAVLHALRASQEAKLCDHEHPALQPQEQKK